MSNTFRNLASSFILAAVVATALSIPRVHPDGSQLPVGITPSITVVNPGQLVVFKVSMSAAVNSDTVVYTSSNSSLLPVPTSVTVKAGSSSAYFSATATYGFRSQDVTVAASANTGLVTTDVTVN